MARLLAASDPGNPMECGVLVLAAGKSTRISPLSDGLPKPLLEFGGRPLIGWTLDWLSGSGIAEVWINLHYRPEVIRSALGDGGAHGLGINYVHEPELLGTAGAWRNVALGWEGTSMVVYGDNLMRFDLGALFERHRESGAAATIAVFDPGQHLNTGIAGGHLVLGEGGLVREFREGEPPRPGAEEYVNAGVYLLEPEVLESIPEGFQDFGRDIFPALLAGGRIHAHIIDDAGFCLGVDTPLSHAEAQRLLEVGRIVLS